MDITSSLRVTLPLVLEKSAWRGDTRVRFSWFSANHSELTVVNFVGRSFSDDGDRHLGFLAG